MNTERLIKRVDELISLSTELLDSAKVGALGNTYLSSELFHEFRSGGLSFIANTFGDSHSHYKEFDKRVNPDYETGVKGGVGILKTLRKEIQDGWVFEFKGLVSAEIFTDFLEMAEYLLNKGYKDASAVMIGSVLEGHIKQLCEKESINLTKKKGDKDVPVKTDTLNSELKNASVYNKIVHKQVTLWLGIRNDAAHSKYENYTKEQVRTMYDGVLDFIARHKI